jgi:hypothetical protein
MTCEIDTTCLFVAILGLICGGILSGFIEAWWKDRNEKH